MTGWNTILCILSTGQLPVPIAKTIPWSALILLLCLAAYYSLYTFLEQRRRKQIQEIALRYKTSQVSRSVYLNITSHYLSTPIAMMQGSLQIHQKNHALHDDVFMAVSTQLDKLAKKISRSVGKITGHFNKPK